MPVIETVSMTFLGTMHHRSTHHSALNSSYNQIEDYATHNPTLATRLFDGPACIGTPQDPTPGTYIYKNGKKDLQSPLVISEYINKFKNFF